MEVKTLRDAHGTTLSYGRVLPTWELELRVQSQAGEVTSFVASQEDMRWLADIFAEAASAAERLAKR